MPTKCLQSLIVKDGSATCGSWAGRAKALGDQRTRNWHVAQAGLHTSAVQTNTSLWRRIEIAAAWSGATLACCAASFALLGPRLGGSAVGLKGLPGFLVEMATATWIHLGALSAGVAVVLLLRRFRWPAAVLGVVALLALLPEWWPHPSPPALMVSQAILRVAAVNLCADNHDFVAMEASIRHLDADVLVMPEFTTVWADQLGKRFPNDYPHRWLGTPQERSHLDEGGRIAVWSRIPGTGNSETRQGYGCHLRVTLKFCGRLFTIYGIHPWPPFPYRQYNGVRQERQTLLDWIRTESLPMIVAGDYNAAPRSPFLLRLRECGLTSAAENFGASPVTWPMNSRAQATLGIAIDHVLHGAAFRAVGFHRGIPNGSDHAPVLAQLTWRD